MSKAFRIAMVGPLPPQRSGIAEYAAGLALLLRQCGIQVDTLTQADVERIGACNVTRLLSRADAVVYQMGNHPGFHGWMLPLMSQVPGIVHLHDLVLHHMAAGVLNDEQRLQSGDYPALLEKWYSSVDVQIAALGLSAGAPVWNSDDVIRMPLHQIATKFATEVIVHSQFAANQISSVFPWLPVNVVPQVYPVVPLHRERAELCTIAVMGGAQANRRFDWIVDALVTMDAKLQRTITLEVAGEVEPLVQEQLDRIAALANVQLINHGHVDDDGFRNLFERADLMIALRQPTMGETSAVVSKALQAGLPTIVSDHGWYAELPACVVKIEPNERCPQELSRLLLDLVRDGTAYASWADECSVQARCGSLDAAAAAAQYAAILKKHGVLSRFRDQLAEAVVGLRVNIDSPLASELQRIDVRAGLRGDRWVNAAIAALDEREVDSRGGLLGSGLVDYPYDAELPENGFRGNASALEEDMGTVQPSAKMSVSIALSNHGGQEWSSPNGRALRPYGIYLGHFWQELNSREQPIEQPRARLEGLIRPGETAIQSIEVQAPERPGEYHLKIDLVQESACWFESRGFETPRIRVRVAAAVP